MHGTIRARHQLDSRFHMILTTFAVAPYKDNLQYKAFKNVSAMIRSLRIPAGKIICNFLVPVL